MKGYVAFLRGINVGGQKKIKMAELRDVLVSHGFQNVRTYIQSGNILFDNDDGDTAHLASEIHQLIERIFGFLVPVLVLSQEVLQTIIERNPFDLQSEEKHLFFTLLKEVPNPDLVLEFEKYHFENEEYHITDQCMYLAFTGGYHKAKLNNNFIEKKLKVEATTRNLKTMQKLLEIPNT